MWDKTTRVLRQHTLWLSLLLHLLFLMNFSFIWLEQPVLEKAPELDIPSYIYRNSVDPVSPPFTQQKKVQQQQKIEKTDTEKPSVTHLPAMNNASAVRVVTTSKETQPVHLIGDKKVDNKLIKLLGKALAAHLIYPKIAIDLNVHGTSLVGFLMHPDGQVTDVQLMKSSGADVLDRAALAGVTAMSPVKNVDEYLTEDKFLVVGIIFG